MKAKTKATNSAFGFLVREENSRRLCFFSFKKKKKPHFSNTSLQMISNGSFMTMFRMKGNGLTRINLQSLTKRNLFLEALDVVVVVL